MSNAPKANAVVAQSGGPTGVINASLAGVIEEAAKHAEIGTLYGSMHAVVGMVKDDFIDLGALSAESLKLVAASPSSAIGTSRDKPDAEYCAKILEVFKKRNIRYFFYIGGNDSANTAHILNTMADKIDFDIRSFHIPKTVDNDLRVTDHCPGFGTAALFEACALMGDDLDNRALPGVKIDVIMGRHAGFLTAATALGRQRDDDGPHLLYFPERPVSMENFLADIDGVMSKLGRCVIAVSEGMCDEDGVTWAKKLVSDLEPIRLLDGNTDGTGWSSGKFDANEPQEIVIRLRERRAWTINRVAIDAATTLSADEIIAKLDELAMDNLRQLTKLRQSDDASQGEIDELAKAVELFGGAVRQARKAAGNQKGRAAAADAARAVAARILGEGGQGTDWLDSGRYRPKEVSVFGAEFGDKLIPKLLFELSDEEKEELADTEGYLAENGWKLLASGAVADGEESVEFEFEAVDATHVLVLVKSNYGVDRVKIGEVRVLTSEAVPEQSRRSAGDVWPNVAAVGFKPSVGWLFLAYIILTAAEVMVSITCLEFSYTQATKKMKSFIMAVFLLSISLGNAFTALVNKFIQNSDGTSKLEGPSYFWFFVIVMAVTAVLFIPVAARYKVKDHIQDEDAGKSEE